jgi:hypothetical protein
MQRAGNVRSNASVSSPHRRIYEQCVIALTGFALPTACIKFSLARKL